MFNVRFYNIYQLGEVGIMGNKEGIMQIEERMGCVGKEWEEERLGKFDGEKDGYRQVL